MAEDEMVGWHHQFNGHEFEQPPRDGEGHGEGPKLGMQQSMQLRGVRHDLANEQQHRIKSSAN